MPSGKRLYRYFTELRYAEAFIKGSLLFRSLSYYRDYEDDEVRADQSEGRATFKPHGGLEITNHTQRTKFTLAGSSFAASVKQDEILVHCMSTALTDEMRRRFGATACVEVHDVAAFCRRLEAALPDAVFPVTSGRPRIGHHVEYYREDIPLQARWALPGRIANSKPESYRWQKEFRLVFSETKALDFMNIKNEIVIGTPTKAQRPPFYPEKIVEAGSLDDICRLISD
ncbi:hypothetical protein [Devosia sp. Root105]|uniref:hypothetical protein n=1 Tax=Devosia sp. Root105 TaxID=1736423 RepID=UPI0006F8FFD1|nr:hypothetical protein [Devosia sp. Root105]KQU95204.1 hypothetical protein ASC68_18810 [Devosia sp. Root105]